jgi:large subunit ribosomal protein L41
MRATQSLGAKIRRLKLQTKNTNKGFYKGTGTGSTGSHTKHGGYLIDWDKVRTYVAPKDLADFKVRDGLRWHNIGKERRADHDTA